MTAVATTDIPTEGSAARASTSWSDLARGAVSRALRPARSGREWGEVLRAVLIAAASSYVILAFAPPPGDASAHLYRTWLVDRGVILWDNLWFGGTYPIVTYSPLYYFIAASVGNTVVNVVGVLISAGCFAAIVVREWGPIASWPARCFGVCAAGPLITGTAPYGLGLAAALASLLAFQRRRRIVGLVLATVVLASSALAFFFLTLTLAAVALTRRCELRHLAIVTLGLAVPVAFWSVTWLLFPTEGRYPFLWWTLLSVVSVSGVGLALALRAPGTRLLAALFGLWLLSSIVLFVVPTPSGEIVTRLRYLVFPLMLLTVLVAGTRPRWLAALALAGAATYNVVPYVANVAVRVEGDRNASEQEFWQPTIDYLETHGSPNHLVEVVATGAHWEVYHLPRAGIPVLRGWYRQPDIEHNELLYDDSTDPADYLDWLHANAVRHVVLPDVRLDPYTGEREANLVRHPDTGLVPVATTGGVTIYEVPDATSLATGPGDARVTELTHDEVHVTVSIPGTYHLRLNWSRYWNVVDGDVTIDENPTTGNVDIRADTPGPFTLAVGVGTDELPLIDG